MKWESTFCIVEHCARVGFCCFSSYDVLEPLYESEVFSSHRIRCDAFLEVIVPRSRVKYSSKQVGSSPIDSR